MTNENRQNNERIVMTADRPTGKLHLGHYVGSIQNRLSLQEKYSKCFYMVADIQALTDNASNPDKVRNNVLEIALDNLAAGVDPARTTFFIQSEIPEIAELTILFMNLVTLARLRRNPTVKSEMKQKGYGENVPAGFLTYPVSQTADILVTKASIVPVGEDQLPVIEQANEIIEKFNTLYKPVFQKIEPIISVTPRLIGLDGGAKMSKSLDNAIYLSDTPEIIEKKVMSMYTDPNHIHVDDPGKVEGNTVFTYLDIFDSLKDEIEALKIQYRTGGLGDVVLKKRLASVLINILAPIQERREYLARDPKQVMGILAEGTKKTRLVAAETMREVRAALKIDYF